MLKFTYNFLILIATFSLFTLENAHACASCGFSDESSPYFLVLIVFMTLIPVICVGSVVYYLKKQSEKNGDSP